MRHVLDGLSIWVTAGLGTAVAYGLYGLAVALSVATVGARCSS